MSRSTMPWRQLLTNPPSNWQRLTLLSRGVGDEVLRALDSDGEIQCGGESPAVVVCRLTAAHPRERRRVAEALDELAHAGFLSIANGVIRGHFPDLAARPKKTASAPEASAESTRSEHDADPESTRSEPEASVNPTRSQPGVEPNSAQSLNSGPVDKTREDKKEEKTRPAAAPVVVVDEPSRLAQVLMLAHDELAPGVGSIVPKSRAEAGATLHERARTLRAEIDDGATIQSLGDEVLARFVEVFRGNAGSRTAGYPPEHLMGALRGTEMARAVDLVRAAHGRPVSKAFKGPRPAMANVPDGQGSAIPDLTPEEAAELEAALEQRAKGARR